MAGYLLKQGTYFSSWNERFFVLDRSFFRQFSDEHATTPSHSIYLGHAVLEGLFSPESNEAYGCGAIWSLCLRWPLPVTDTDLIDGSETVQWGYMHLGAYEEGQILVWRDAIASAIKFEQQKFLMNGAEEKRHVVDPVESRIIPSGRSPVCVKYDSDFEKKLPLKFRCVYENFVTWTNSKSWNLVDSDDGLLYQIKRSNVWRYVTTIPAPGKRVWEALLSESVGKWEPLVKHSHTEISHQANFGTQFYTDTARLVSGGTESAVDRIAFAGDEFFVILGAKRHTATIQSIVWVVESGCSQSSSVLSMYFEMIESPKFFQSTTGLAKAITHHPIRLREFIACRR
jgi:hypothetical protein